MPAHSHACTLSVIHSVSQSVSMRDYYINFDLSKDLHLVGGLDDELLLSVVVRLQDERVLVVRHLQGRRLSSLNLGSVIFRVKLGNYIRHLAESQLV